MVKFLDGGFSFGLIYPRFGAEEAGNLKISIGTDKKIPNKSLFFLFFFFLFICVFIYDCVGSSFLCEDFL